MEPLEDTQVIVLKSKEDIADEIESNEMMMEYEDPLQELLKRQQNRDEIQYALFVKLVIENGENYNDWIYSVPIEIPDCVILHEFANKTLSTLEFQFSEAKIIPRQTHVRAIVYWKNSEGERSEETIVNYDVYVVDEEKNRMFVKIDKESSFCYETDQEFYVDESELKRESKKLYYSLMEQHYDVFASEKEQTIQLSKIRKTVSEFERKYRKNNPSAESKHKLEENDISLYDTSKKQRIIIDVEKKEEESTSANHTDSVVFAMIECPISQNESGAFLIPQNENREFIVQCHLNIEQLLSFHFSDLWRHYHALNNRKQEGKEEKEEIINAFVR